MGIVIRQSIKGTVMNYIGAFLGFLTIMFVSTRYLKPEEIGLLNLFIAASGFVAGIAQLGIGASAFRFFPYFKDETRNKQHNGFFFYLVATPFVGLLIILPVVIFYKDFFCDFLKANSPLFVQYYNWLIPLVCFTVYFSVFEIYSTLLMRIVVPKFIREILIRVLLVLLYLLYAFHYLNLTQFVTGFVSIYGIAMLTTFLYVAKIGNVSLSHKPDFITPQLRNSFLSYTSIITLGSMGGALMGRIDTFMISAEVGLAATGVYTIAFFMATIIEIPNRSITGISSPLMANAVKTNDRILVDKLYKDVSLHQLLTSSFILVLIWSNIDSIFAIIPNGANYQVGKWVVLFIGASKVIDAFLGFGHTIISFSKYYYINLFFVFFLAALTIYSNYIFIPIYGITGAALATAITCLVSYCIQQAILQFIMKVSPFSIASFKTIGVGIIIYVAGYLLPHLSNPYLDIPFRSIIILALGIPLVYFLNISQEVNKLAHTALEFLKIRKPNQNHD